MEKDLEFIVKEIKEAFSKYGKIETPILSKDSHDIVTNVDLSIEKYLIDKINEKYPNDNILSEENNPTASLENRTWTIDPIDGTFNFANNIPWYGVQVALIINKEVCLSVIYLPEKDEIYTALKGKGAYLNQEKFTTKTQDIKKSMISFSDFSHKSLEDIQIQSKIMTNIAPKVGKIRMIGAACFDFTFLALGKIQGCIMIKPNIWDVAPGLLIAKEAGVLITYDWQSKYLIGSTSQEIDELIKKSCYNNFKEDK